MSVLHQVCIDYERSILQIVNDDGDVVQDGTE